LRSKHIKSVYVREGHLPSYDAAYDICLRSGRSLNSLIGCFLEWFSAETTDPGSLKFKADLLEKALLFGQRELPPFKTNEQMEDV